MLAVLYDVHGNLPALDAVLAEAHAAGATRWLLGGDYALFGAWPKETVVRLSELRGATWIRGNGERWTNAPAEAPPPVRPAARWCAAQLGDAAVARLAALPAQAVLDGIRCCHGSPLSDTTGLLPEAAPGEAALLSEVREPLLIAGHTHLPLLRGADGREDLRLLNPGSVGMPFDGDPRAAFALVDDDGTVQRRRVAYDHMAAAAAVRARLGGAGSGGAGSGGAGAEDAAAIADLVARRIEQARIDPA